jgi:Na+/melibiose symporter-like transporter
MSASIGSAGPVEAAGPGLGADRPAGSSRDPGSGLGAELGRSTLVAYGLPGLVTAIPTIPVFTLLPAYYAEDVGLGLAVTGAVLFAGRVLDLISDPLIGVLADRFGGGRGLATLVLIGALIGAPSLILLLSPPAGMTVGAGAAWLLATSAFLYLGWTLVQIPYLTWGARLSPDYHQRTRVTASREGWTLGGIMLSASLPAAMGFLALDEGQRLAALGWIAVALGLPAFYLLLQRVPSPALLARASWDWRGITENRLFLRLLGAWFLNGLANGIPAVLFPLYCAHVLAVDDQTRNLLLALYFGCAVVGIPLWLSLSRHLSRHRAWALAMAITCPAFAFAALLGPGDAAAFALICVVTGLCLGADLALPPAIQADVADWDRLRFRRNRTAGLFALWGMATKLALALAAGLTLPALGALGLGEAPPPALALTALALTYALIPCVLKLTAVALMHGLPLTQARQAAVAARLHRRDRAAIEA